MICIKCNNFVVITKHLLFINSIYASYYVKCYGYVSRYIIVYPLLNFYPNFELLSKHIVSQLTFSMQSFPITHNSLSSLALPYFYIYLLFILFCFVFVVSYLSRPVSTILLKRQGDISYSLPDITVQGSYRLKIKAK